MSAITPKQIKQIHVLRRQARLTEEQYRQMLREHFGATTCKDLSLDDARRLCVLLRIRVTAATGKAQTAPTGRKQEEQGRPGRLTPLQIVKIKALWSRVTRATTPESSAKALRGFVKGKTGVSELVWVPRLKGRVLIGALEAMLKSVEVQA